MPAPEAASSFLAWWGAILSTVLGSVKLWELWRDRFRLDLSYNFTGSEDVGNDILIRNLTGRPLILTYWEVMYGSGQWLRRKYETVAYPDHDDGDTRIDPHSTLTLNFSGEQHFAWGTKMLRGRSVYIRLHIAGRRSFVRRVYP
jgi:hypothetical protein